MFEEDKKIVTPLRLLNLVSSWGRGGKVGACIAANDESFFDTDMFAKFGLSEGRYVFFPTALLCM